MKKHSYTLTALTLLSGLLVACPSNQPTSSTPTVAPTSNTATTTSTTTINTTTTGNTSTGSTTGTTVITTPGVTPGANPQLFQESNGQMPQARAIDEGYRLIINGKTFETKGNQIRQEKVEAINSGTGYMTLSTLGIEPLSDENFDYTFKVTFQNNRTGTLSNNFKEFDFPSVQMEVDRTDKATKKTYQYFVNTMPGNDITIPTANNPAGLAGKKSSVVFSSSTNPNNRYSGYVQSYLASNTEPNLALIQARVEFNVQQPTTTR